jgi:hypothetical protein
MLWSVRAKDYDLTHQIAYFGIPSIKLCHYDHGTTARLLGLPCEVWKALLKGCEERLGIRTTMATMGVGIGVI